MLVAVYQRFLAAGIIAPEHEDNALLAVGYGLDDRIGESLPAYSAVGGGGAGPDGQDRIEEKYALAGPSLEVAAGRGGAAGIGGNFLVDILEGGRQCNSVLNGE